MRVLKILGTGLFTGVAFVGAIAIVVAMLAFDSPYLVVGLDLNLKVLKFVAAQLPQGFGNRTEALLRVWNFERALLFTELMAIVKLLMLAVGRMFRIN